MVSLSYRVCSYFITESLSLFPSLKLTRNTFFLHCFYLSLFNLPIIYSNHCQVSQQENNIFFHHIDCPRLPPPVFPTPRLPLLSTRARNNCTGFTTGSSNTAVGNTTGNSNTAVGKSIGRQHHWCIKHCCWTRTIVLCLPDPEQKTPAARVPPGRSWEESTNHGPTPKAKSSPNPKPEARRPSRTRTILLEPAGSAPSPRPRQTRTISRFSVIRYYILWLMLYRFHIWCYVTHTTLCESPEVL